MPECAERLKSSYSLFALAGSIPDYANPVIPDSAYLSEGSVSLRYLMEARMRSAFLLPLFVATSLAQTPSQDPQMTQALLSEMSGLKTPKGFLKTGRLK